MSTHNQQERTFPPTRSCPFSPPAEYGRMREEDPVRQVTLWSGQRIWAVSRYQDVRTVLTDERFSADITREGFPLMRPSVGLAFRSVGRRNFMRMDGPEHARLRKMVAQDFTAKAVERWRPDIQTLTDGIIDRLLGDGKPFDLVAKIAEEIPTRVICWMLGIPEHDRAYFRDLTTRYMSTQSTPEETKEVVEGLIAYLDRLIDTKREQPENDMLSRLVHEHLLTGDLDREDLNATARLMLVAGHETSVSMISMGTLALLEHPEKWAALRADPTQLPDAVEELLRYLTVVHQTAVRVTAEEVEIGGVVIPEGQGVIALTSSADRDGAYFADPDTIDWTRAKLRQHFAFGYGPHHCLGHLLAKVELQVVFATLLRRMPTLRLAVPFTELEFKNDQSITGVTRLPVTW
ncbi:cytochrome P450 [Streptomyces sp. NRRL S-920]|uniref:cytochrome P450 n=1 Tax=Streptomyces sp. NRRL S-920 TaxID=1463921 RepID=UPI0004C6D4C9|nr:cytochrome P450 [Streptomyces sp. NRRL S-920]